MRNRGSGGGGGRGGGQGGRGGRGGGGGVEERADMVQYGEIEQVVLAGSRVDTEPGSTPAESSQTATDNLCGREAFSVISRNVCQVLRCAVLCCRSVHTCMYI